MSEPKGFFGNIFESSEEDPLLQSDPASDDNDEASGNEASGNEASRNEASRNAASSDASSSGASSSGGAPRGLFSGTGDAHDTESASARASDARNEASWDEDDETRRVTVTESHDPWADRLTWEGLDTLNDAVQTGWHVVDIDAKRQASDDTRLTLEFILERDIPRSLFDFGPSW